MGVRKYVVAGLGALALASTPAQADIYCHGLVQTVSVQPAGDFWIDWGFGFVQICNVNADFSQPLSGGGSQAYGYKTCQAMLSIAITAQASAKELWVRFPNDTDCNLNNTGGVIRNIALFTIK